MLRLLVIVSGAFEAVFGASALLTPNMVIDALGTGSGLSAVFFARILGAATLALGVAALLARNALATSGGLAVAYGLTLYNVLAGALIIWMASSGAGSASLWAAGLFHALIGALFVYALAANGKSPG